MWIDKHALPFSICKPISDRESNHIHNFHINKHDTKDIVLNTKKHRDFCCILDRMRYRDYTKNLNRRDSRSLDCILSKHAGNCKKYRALNNFCKCSRRKCYSCSRR